MGQSPHGKESHLPSRISVQIFLFISKRKLVRVLLLNLRISHLLAHTLQEPHSSGRRTDTHSPPDEEVTLGNISRQRQALGRLPSHTVTD